MKIIINTTNLVVGGAIQVALSFLHELKSFRENVYFVFLSADINVQIDKSSFSDNFFFYIFEQSPAPIRNRRTVTKRLNLLESQICPDIVFSVFSPSYWRPQAPHVMGFAIGWTVNPDSVVFKTISIRKRLENYYKIFYVKRDADFYIVETKDVQQRLTKYLKIDAFRISVVGNTYSQLFDEDFELYPIPTDPEKFNFISICANYPHKNLKIIKDIIPFLEAASIKCHFWLTIPPDQFKQDYSHLSDWVSNIGPVDVRFCPSLYEQCDALFLPTLLESFTASYPEAMKMKKPILTSDLSFAHAICGNAAEYFNPQDPKSIAEAIIKICLDSDRQQELISYGTERLKSFPTARERAKQYLEICQDIVQMSSPASQDLIK